MPDLLLIFQRLRFIVNKEQMKRKTTNGDVL